MSAVDDRLAAARRDLHSLRPERWTPQLIDELALRAHGLESLGASLRSAGVAASDAARRRAGALERARAGRGAVVGRRLALLAVLVAAVPFVLTFPRSTVLGDVPVAQSLLSALVAALLAPAGLSCIRSAMGSVTALVASLAAACVVAVAIDLGGEQAGWPATVALVAAIAACAAAVAAVLSALLRRRAFDDHVVASMGIRQQVRDDLDGERLRMRDDLDVRARAAGGDATAIRATRRALLDEVEATRRPAPRPLPGSRLLEPEPIDAVGDAPPGAWIVDTLVRMPRDATDVQLEQSAERIARRS